MQPRLIARPRVFDPVLMLPACMGGWCAYRDHCWRHITPDRRHVSERLCTRGHETPEQIRAHHEEEIQNDESQAQEHRVP